MRGFLLITYSEELQDGEPFFAASNCLPAKALNYEPAGHAFHSAALKLTGLYLEDGADSDEQSELSDERNHSHTPFTDFYSNKGKKKSGSGDKQQDHYALLGLGHMRFLATEEQIRKSYREAALKHHPDKQAAVLLAEETEDAKQAKKDEIESRFKSIQEAYEILIDPVKRRIFDSTDEFDDEIPMECAPHDFFKVFGPAFLRNARWSVSQPAPSLGDAKTGLVDVDGFYNFWYSFKSWREFPHADDFDLDQAESRDHKRWMERQNAKLREKAKKEEYTRIRALVDGAYKRDPRILQRKEVERIEKQRKKEAKFLAKKLQEEEAVRAAEKERQRVEAEEKIAAEAALIQKKQKEKDKKLMRKERNRLRAFNSSFMSDSSLALSEEEIESLCLALEIDQLRNLCDDMEKGDEVERALLLNSALKREAFVAGGKNTQVDITSVEPRSTFSGEKKVKPWGKEEIEMLRKGVQKYPKGTSRRWEVISEYIGTKRSVEEILKATKTVLLQKPDSTNAFNTFLEKRKPAPSIASPLTTRVESDGFPVNGDVSQPAAVNSSSGDVNHEKTEACASNGALPDDAWSSAQERALVQALKTFPKETGRRWERVAAAVPAKNVIQCKKKFALMKENFRSIKGSD